MGLCRTPFPLLAMTLPVCWPTPSNGPDPRTPKRCEMRWPRPPDSKVSPARYRWMPIETLPNPD